MTSLWHSPTLLEVMHDRAADSAAIVSGPSPDDLQDDQRPAGDPRLRPHPASIPGVFPDYFARSLATCQTAREMAPAKDALWLQRSLPDDA